jgi:hypothetical protein
LNGDVNRAGFTIEADMIKEALDRQVDIKSNEAIFKCIY